jgi:glutamyl-tRNA reductase
LGNALAMTTSIESGFGARLMVSVENLPGGFLLNNQLTDFSFTPQDEHGRPVANRVQAGKRPRSSMSPTLVFGQTDDGERGELLARQHNAQVMRLADLPDRLHEFDAVISCTASTLPLIGLGAVQRALRARKNRPMFMVDLAVPRDIESDVKDLSGVYLYTIDDLTQVINSGQTHRQEAVAEAEVIIDEGVEKFMAWLERRSHVPLIQELNLQADAWRQTELTRARKRIENGQSVDSVLESLSMALMKKMLNGPLRELNHPDGVHREKALQAVKHIFLND